MMTLTQNHIGIVACARGGKLLSLRFIKSSGDFRLFEKELSTIHHHLQDQLLWLYFALQENERISHVGTRRIKNVMPVASNLSLYVR